MVTIRHGRDNYSQHGDLIKWCEQYFGELYLADWYKSESEDRRWQISCAFGNAMFSFKDEEDAVLFKLHWGGDWLEDFPSKLHFDKNKINA